MIKIDQQERIKAKGIMDNIFLIVNKKIIEEKKIVGILDELFNSDDDDDFDVSESGISENNNKV